MQAFAALRHEGVEIDQGRDLLAHPVRDAADNAASVGVPHQDHIPQFFPPDEVGDIVDMGFQVHLAG